MSSSFSELIKQREHQHALKLQELMAANQELLSRLEAEAVERQSTEQRLQAIEGVVTELREAIRQSTVSQREVIERMGEDVAMSSETITGHVDALLEDAQHQMHERLLEQQLSAWEVMKNTLGSKAEVAHELAQDCSDRVTRNEDAVAAIEDRITRFEGCIDKALDEANHRLQRSLVSQIYLTLFSDLGDRFLLEMELTRSWHRNGTHLQQTWDTHVNRSLHEFERTAKRINDSYPEMMDQRVTSMVEELNRAAESLESIVKANTRREMVGSDIQGSDPEVLRRVKALEDSMGKVAVAVETIRKPRPSAWRQDVPLELENRSMQTEHAHATFPHPHQGHHGRPSLRDHHDWPGSTHPVPDTTRVSPERTIVPAMLKELHDAEATVTETTEWRHSLLVNLQRRMGLKDAPWEEILMIDAASSVERLYARADELAARKEEQEMQLDRVNSMLGHIQNEFLRLTEREGELSRMPHSAEWRETLAQDPSRDADGLRNHLAQLQENLSHAKHSVYARERTLIDQRNDLWRVLSDVNEEVSHVQKQIDYYQDVLGTEQVLTARLASGQRE
jgi:hypothetical protein